MASVSWSGNSIGRRRHDVTVTAGSTSSPILVLENERPTVTAIPGSGGTALVEFSTSSHAAIDAGTATWGSWDVGTISARDSRRLVGEIRGLRFTATTADAVFEVTA